MKPDFWGPNWQSRPKVLTWLQLSFDGSFEAARAKGLLCPCSFKFAFKSFAPFAAKKVDYKLC